MCLCAAFFSFCTNVLCEASALFLQLWVGLTCIWLVSAPFWSINAVFLVQQYYCIFSCHCLSVLGLTAHYLCIGVRYTAFLFSVVLPSLYSTWGLPVLLSCACKYCLSCAVSFWGLLVVPLNPIVTNMQHFSLLCAGAFLLPLHVMCLPWILFLALSCYCSMIKLSCCPLCCTVNVIYPVHCLCITAWCCSFYAEDTTTVDQTA